MDLAVKARYFRHLIGGDDPDAEDIYFWHIEKRSGQRMAAGLRTDQWKACLEDYRASSAALLASMQEAGFDPSQAIPIDGNRELMGGAHRLACAIALDLDKVPVIQYTDRFAWPPAWDLQWFADAGMPVEILRRTVDDLIKMLP